MVPEMITPREFLERLERKAEQLKAMELLHCCMMNRIKYYKECED